MELYIRSEIMTLTGNTILVEVTLLKLFCQTSEKESTLKGKILLHWAPFSGFTHRKVKGTVSRPRWLSWMPRPTGDQEVAGSTPAEVGNILSWRLIMKYFLRSFSPIDSRRAVVSFWLKNVHNTG